MIPAIPHTSAIVDGRGRVAGLPDQSEEVAQHLRTRRVLLGPLLGVELRTPPGPSGRGDRLHLTGGASRQHAETVRQLRYLVGVIVEDVRLARKAGEQISVVDDLDR